VALTVGVGDDAPSVDGDAVIGAAEVDVVAGAVVVGRAVLLVPPSSPHAAAAEASAPRTTVSNRGVVRGASPCMTPTKQPGLMWR
jgi:hypothetical protein